MYAHAQNRCSLVLLLVQCLIVTARAYYHKGDDGRYYKFHTTRTHWQGASEACKREDAHLAILDTKETVNYIADTFRYITNGVWVGAKWYGDVPAGGNGNTTGDWRWEDKSVIMKTSWAAGKPTPSVVVVGNGTTDEVVDVVEKKDKCIMMNFGSSDGHLHDADCNWQEPQFLCQKDHRSCVYETGSCVTSQGSPVNSTILIDDVTTTRECLEACLAHPNATGCWVIETAPPPNTTEKGQNKCHVTFSDDVTKGSGDELGTCWIISKCEGTGPLAPPRSKLPSDYIDHKDFASYKLYMTKLDYDKAKLKCHEDGATLAIDDSQVNHDFVMNTFPGITFWIGINDLEQRGIWKFEDSTPLEMQSRYWDHGRPTNQRCVEMWHNGRWRDDSCKKQKYFLCEKQGQYVKDAIKGSSNILLPIVIIGVVVGLIIVGGIVYATVCRRTNDGEEGNVDSAKGVPNAGSDGAATDPVKPGKLKGGQEVVDVEKGEDDASSYYNESVEHDEVRSEPMVMYRPTADEATVEEGGKKKKNKNK